MGRSPEDRNARTLTLSLDPAIRKAMQDEPWKGRASLLFRHAVTLLRAAVRSSDDITSRLAVVLDDDRIERHAISLAPTSIPEYPFGIDRWVEGWPEEGAARSRATTVTAVGVTLMDLLYRDVPRLDFWKRYVSDDGGGRLRLLIQSWTAAADAAYGPFYPAKFHSQSVLASRRGRVHEALCELSKVAGPERLVVRMTSVPLTVSTLLLERSDCVDLQYQPYLWTGPDFEYVAKGPKFALRAQPGTDVLSQFAVPVGALWEKATPWDPQDAPPATDPATPAGTR